MAKTRKYNQRKSTRGKTPKKKNKMRQKGSGRSTSRSRKYNNLNACELIDEKNIITGCRNGSTCYIITKKHTGIGKKVDCQARCINNTCVGWTPSTSIVPSHDSTTKSLQRSAADHQKYLSNRYKDHRMRYKYTVSKRSL